MDNLDPYAAPKSGVARPPHDATPIPRGCCLITGAGGLLGLIVGGAYGVHQFNAAVDEAVREHGFADYLPVGVPVWAIFGTVLGAMSGLLSVVAWLLVFGPQGRDDHEG